MSMSELSPASPVALVRPADLYELYEQVVGVYAFSACAYLGRPNDAPSQGLDVEFQVRIRGALQGRVVLRTTLGGARQLAEGLHSETRASDGEAVDAFRETCNLFTGHLLTSCLGGQRRLFDPFLPEPSTPKDWPAGSPDAAVALLLETEPVELRYWQESRS
jgi:hypothetical protein